MKKAYQIDERKAHQPLPFLPQYESGKHPMVPPLADLAQRLRHGVSQMLFDTERDLLMLIMSEQVNWLSQEHGMERWATAPGSVIIHGQKVPVQRPRVRDRAKEAKLGSYELFRLDDEMQRRLWDRVMRGLSIRVPGTNQYRAFALRVNMSASASFSLVGPIVLSSSSEGAEWSKPVCSWSSRWF